MTEEEKGFIRSNVQLDVNQLILNPPAQFADNIKWLAGQIRSRQKARTKLPGWYENLDLVFPPALSVEQASSEQTSEYKSRWVQGDHLVDLTGGMGIDTLALSKHFRRTTYLEQNADLVDTFHSNAESLGSDIECIHGDAANFLEAFSGKACFYIDPARRDLNQRKVYCFQDCTPEISTLVPHFRSKARQVLVKASPLVDLKQGMDELANVTQIHVVSVSNECKEVLFLMDFEKPAQEVTIKTINMTVRGEELFQFTFDEEQLTRPEFGTEGIFLLLPNVSILKAGAFSTISARYGLKKVAVNTHIYSSRELVSGFPGRQFQVIDENPDRRSLKGKSLNVISRNHPMKAPEITKKLKLKDGGNEYLMAFRDDNQSPKMVLCKKLG